MLRNLKTSGSRLLFAGILCLLATAFAVEAKIAWYGPFTGPGSEVRAAKALPSDVPSVTDYGGNLSSPFHLPTSLTLLAVISADSLAYIINIYRRELPACAIRNCSSDYFSPLPLRAPPIAS